MVLFGVKISLCEINTKTATPTEKIKKRMRVVSRILFLNGDHLSGISLAAELERLTRPHSILRLSGGLFSLAPGGVYQPDMAKAEIRSSGSVISRRKYHTRTLFTFAACSNERAVV